MECLSHLSRTSCMVAFSFQSRLSPRKPRKYLVFALAHGRSQPTYRQRPAAYRPITNFYYFVFSCKPELDLEIGTKTNCSRVSCTVLCATVNSSAGTKLNPDQNSSGSSARRPSPHPSTKDFILRARVLKLYRQALRTARRAPPHSQAELRQTIRQEMENNRNCNDRQRVRYLISEGLERLKGLSEMLDMQGHC
ncbi:hypothetical protein FNV43_RR12016 [Rhamnella rubrinervis]|uniref:LYR motif-containing protein 2 n=1 Tax=Rhamnella rubrinervis TaxID=2594499 RepID=A0A8K0H6L4_9ROSA|nr:hypothetical protein FNV43_RR12016 [Rhamnella rubrinervis]